MTRREHPEVGAGFEHADENPDHRVQVFLEADDTAWWRCATCGATTDPDAQTGPGDH